MRTQLVSGVPRRQAHEAYRLGLPQLIRQTWMGNWTSQLKRYYQIQEIE